MGPRRVRNPAASISLGDLAARVRVPMTPQTMLSTYASRFTVDTMLRGYRLFDGDLLLFLVFGEIAHYNMSRALRALSVPETADSQRWKALLRALPRQKVAPCNALSVSQSTGLPRETVRRKVKALVERGWLAREGTRDLTLTPRAIEFLGPSGRAIMEDFNATARVIRLLEEALALQRRRPEKAN